MARYWVNSVGVRASPPLGNEGLPSDSGLALVVQVTYFGSDVSRGAVNAIFDVPILNADTPTQVQTKLVNAVVSEGAALGITVARNAGLLPAFQRGS